MDQWVGVILEDLQPVHHHNPPMMNSPASVSPPPLDDTVTLSHIQCQQLTITNPDRLSSTCHASPYSHPRNQKHYLTIHTGGNRQGSRISLRKEGRKGLAGDMGREWGYTGYLRAKDPKTVFVPHHHHHPSQNPSCCLILEYIPDPGPSQSKTYRSMLLAPLNPIHQGPRKWPPGFFYR